MCKGAHVRVEYRYKDVSPILNILGSGGSRMYPHLHTSTCTRGIQVLQPLDPSGSSESGRTFDESTSWYEPDSTPSGPTEEELEVNMDDDIQT